MMSKFYPSRLWQLMIAAVITLALSMPLAAQSAGSADPVSTWDYLDTPAALGFFPDQTALGVRLSIPAVDFSPEGLETYDLDFALLSPGFAYRYRNSGETQEHLLASGFAINELMSSGYRLRWDGINAEGLSFDMGLMLRPAPFISFACNVLTLYSFESTLETDILAGLSLRPFSFNKNMERLLTLSVDALWQDDAIPEIKAGARILFNDWISMQGNWDFASQSLSAGLWVNLNNLETSIEASPSSFFSSPASFSQALRFGRTSKSWDRAVNKSVLVLGEMDNVIKSPPIVDNGPGINNSAPIWFDLALAALERASVDPGISALAIYRIPAFDSDARALEFSRALSRFKAAGKPIYVHAESFDRRSYAFIAAAADLISLDPNGMLPIHEVSYVSVYFKGLLEKYGIDTYSLQSHETKTANNRYTERTMTEAERSMMQRWVDGLASSAAGRMAVLRAEKFGNASGELFSKGPWMDPRGAVEAGLVDELLYRDEFDKKIEEAQKGRGRINMATYAREKSLSWSRPAGKRVVIVHLSGSIIEDEGEAGKSIGNLAVKALQDIANDQGISGVILRVDSGGGSAKTSDHLARAVKQLKEKGKKVVVSMSGFAASGGYYLSALADHIVAEENTVTGSIGVTGFNINVSRLLEKLELGVGYVSANESEIFSNPLTPHREADDARYREMIMYVYDRFVDTVAEGRKMDREKVDEIGKGQVWLGKEALANGLVDELGGLDEAKAAMEKLLGKKARYEDRVPGTVSFWDFLPKQIQGALALPSTLAETFGTIRDLKAMGEGPLYLEPVSLGAELK